MPAHARFYRSEGLSGLALRAGERRARHRPSAESSLAPN
jgi:hypothetical protein